VGNYGEAARDGGSAMGEAARSRGLKFLGSYLYQLDEKGRVSLPAAFRREAPDQRFVMVQVHPPALSVYPEAEWVGVEERLDELLRHQPEARLYVLRVLSNAVEVVPDGQGRILIPSRLKEAAELDGQALLVGAIRKIEIWNPARFEAAIGESAGEFERFAPQIFR
jgi:MraZ protein